MKRSILSFGICFCLSLAAFGQTAPPTGGTRPTAKATPRPTPKPTPTTGTTGAAGSTGATGTQDAKPEVNVADLIEQGKTYYKKANYQQALARFEAALKVEPDRDDALALAAETAFRYDNQLKARTWFLRRAELPNQKSTVKAFSYYRAAMTYWREAHDNVAMLGTYKSGKTVMGKLPEKNPPPVEEQIGSGLHYVEKCLALTPQYAEAHNLKNLLLSESSWLKADTTRGDELQAQAYGSLRRAIELMKGRDPKTLMADFGAPTLRIGEYASTKAEEAAAEPAVIAGLTGGTVVKRINPIFPTAVARSTEGDDNPDRAGRRGALTAATTPGKVKVEVLISTAGDVVFAHIVQGRSDLNGAAIAAARGWKFTPAKFEDHPVQLSAVITFDMRPGGRAAAPTPTPKPQQ